MVVATCAEAYARTEVSHKGGVDAPQRTLQRTDDGITVAYTFAGNAPSACNDGDGGCVWRIDGFGLRDDLRLINRAIAGDRRRLAGGHAVDRRIRGGGNRGFGVR